MDLIKTTNTKTLPKKGITYEKRITPVAVPMDEIEKKDREENKEKAATYSGVAQILTDAANNNPAAKLSAIEAQINVLTDDLQRLEEINKGLAADLKKLVEIQTTLLFIVKKSNIMQPTNTKGES